MRYKKGDVKQIQVKKIQGMFKKYISKDGKPRCL